MNFQLLEQVISQFKKFEIASDLEKKATIIDFANWIQLENQMHSTPKEPLKFGNWQSSIEVGISKLLVHLYRYARIHIRHSMSDFPELVSEDFTYLYSLVRYGNMTKIQLIEKNIHEKSTGQEIIKRLIKNNLLAEEIDPKDKRCKLLTLTKKGSRAYMNSYQVTSNVAKVITGPLTSSEKQTLFHLLKKLDRFHNPIFLNRENKTLSQLLTLVNSKQEKSI